ncbi:orotidine-5'-phosphate decarboxylase [bacterium]|nr:orotidine-5'-phosphate decarboxylase [bacterium]
MSLINFADQITDLMKRKKSRVIVGLDPAMEHAPLSLQGGEIATLGLGTREISHGRQWAMREFCERIIEATADITVGYKVQVAYFERFGSAGLHILERLLLEHEEKLFILDGKRGDIGATSEAYADAYFHDYSDEDKSPLLCDAVTLNGYLGRDALEPFFKHLAKDKGAFVLAKTSNPSSGDLQDLKIGEDPVYVHMARLVHEWGQDFVGACGYSALGLVVGATYPEAARAVREVAPKSLILVPGIGVQGGKPKDAQAFCGADGLGAVFNFSRSIIYAHKFGPFADEHDDEDFANAARVAAEYYRASLNDVLGEP